MFNKILVPLDGSKTAEKVLPYARYLAGKFKAPVELLAVIDIAEMATHISAEKVRHLDTMIADGERASAAYLSAVASTFPDGKVTCTVEKDRTEDAIIRKAEADGGTLIAMATHGRSGLNRLRIAFFRRRSHGGEKQRHDVAVERRELPIHPAVGIGHGFGRSRQQSAIAILGVQIAHDAVGLPEHEVAILDRRH